MKDSLKIYETMEENGFYKPENQFPPARISSVFKNWFPVIAVTVSASRKKLSSKVTVFIREEYPSPMARTKDSFKNKFPGDRKKAFSDRSLWKKDWFELARKSGSTTRNKAFGEKYVSSIRKNYFRWKQNQRKWFPPAGKCFSFKIGSP